MKKDDLTKLVTEQAIGKVADEGFLGIKEITTRFVGNYCKRRNVGYGVVRSVSGSFQETKNYYSDLFIGRDPVVMQEAIFFNDKK